MGENNSTLQELLNRFIGCEMRLRSRDVALGAADA